MAVWLLLYRDCTSIAPWWYGCNLCMSWRRGGGAQLRTEGKGGECTDEVRTVAEAEKTLVAKKADLEVVKGEEVKELVGRR